MNLPNTMTLSRIVLAPIFLTLFMLHLGSPNPGLAFLILFVFGLGEITDLLDGIIARKLHLTSDLGKLLDPFADVVSRLTYFLALLLSDIIPFWFFALILYRELGITFWRLHLVQNHVVLAASLGGKAKAWLYFGVSLAGLLSWLGRSWGWGWEWSDLNGWLWIGFLILTAGLSLGTFLEYLVRGIALLKERPKDNI